MSFLKSVLSAPGKLINKGLKTVGLGENNFISKASASSQLAKAFDSGKPLNFRTILNPSGKGNLFDPVGAFQKDQTDPEAEAAAAKAQADADQQAADNAATSATNQQLLARRRRRVGSALATGATSGGGLYSAPAATPVSYGKSLLGG